MSDWIEWDGSNGGHPDLPLNTKVLVRFRDDSVSNTSALTVKYWMSHARMNNWIIDGPTRIVAYKVVTDV